MFQFIEHDINLPLSIGNIDQIYNLACPASPKQYQKEPINTLETNLIGTKNLLELAKANNARFLLASTSEVYGDPQVHPQREDYFGNVNTFGPRACYDEGKRCAETVCYEYNRMHNIEIRVARIFNTYGPKMQIDDGRVISNFIVGALSKNTINIYGDGKQTRCFCYVDDMIDGLVNLMNSNCSTPINIGSEHEITIGELAFQIKSILKADISTSNHTLPQDDPLKRKPNLSKAYRELDWEVKTSLKCGLKKTVDYFSEVLAYDE